jgi:hypothetical protein
MPTYHHYGLLEILHEPEAAIGICSFGTITRKWKTWRLRAEHTAYPMTNSLRQPGGEEFSLPCPLDALF